MSKIMDLVIGNGGHINMWNKGFFEYCSKAAGCNFNEDDYIIIGQFRIDKKEYENNKEKFDNYMNSRVIE